MGKQLLTGYLQLRASALLLATLEEKARERNLTLSQVARQELAKALELPDQGSKGEQGEHK